MATAIPQTVLRIRKGTETSTRAVGPSGAVRIGRAPDNDIVLDDPLVSRYHAAVDWLGDAFCVRDLGSSNGTRVNDQEIEPKIPRSLKPGDRIQVGVAVLELDDTRNAPEHATKAAPGPGGTMLLGSGQSVDVALPPVRVPTTRFTLRAGQALTLGRAPTCDVVLAHPAVSLRHARVIRGEAESSIQDLESTNGTFVNGRQVPAGTTNLSCPATAFVSGRSSFSSPTENSRQSTSPKDFAWTRIT